MKLTEWIFLCEIKSVMLRNPFYKAQESYLHDYFDRSFPASQNHWKLTENELWNDLIFLVVFLIYSGYSLLVFLA